eukprot:11461899-Prorocentrum_lima.AAC.1
MLAGPENRTEWTVSMQKKDNDDWWAQCGVVQHVLRCGHRWPRVSASSLAAVCCLCSPQEPRGDVHRPDRGL